MLVRDAPTLRSSSTAEHRHLFATDLDWSRGKGLKVRAKVIDLVLLVANRHQVLVRLEGPGLQGL